MGYFRSKGRLYRYKIRIIKIIVFIIIIIIIIYITKDNHIKEENINSIPKLTYLENNNLEPIIYIYNTHQKEKYSYDKIESYNVDYTVLFSSYILKWYLKDLGINSIVETSSISNILKENNWSYAGSYKASRTLLEKAILKYPSLNFFIDVHRDSSVYKKTTCEIDGTTYAKILFVVGLDHDNYKPNLELANTLNKRIIRINPCLSRGVYKKSGKGVNGIYNQDFNPNTILIEVGGQYNSISEAKRTLKVMASILYEYIMEDA